MKHIFIEHQLYISTIIANGVTRWSIADIIITHRGSQHSDINQMINYGSGSLEIEISAMKKVVRNHESILNGNQV